MITRNLYGYARNVNKRKILKSSNVAKVNTGQPCYETVILLCIAVTYFLILTCLFLRTSLTSICAYLVTKFLINMNSFKLN